MEYLQFQELPGSSQSQILVPTLPIAKRCVRREVNPGCSAGQCLCVWICYCTGQCTGLGFAKVYSKLLECVLKTLPQVWASGCCVPAELTMMFAFNLLRSGLQCQKVLPCYPQHVSYAIRWALKDTLDFSVEPALLQVLHKHKRLPGGWEGHGAEAGG